MLRSVSILLGAVIAVNLLGLTRPEPPHLALTVTDLQNQPIEGVRISAKGASGSSFTDSNGEIRLALKAGTEVDDWVELVITRNPSDQDWVFVSPWDGRVSVPATGNYRSVFLAERGDRDLLRSGKVLEAIMSGFIRENEALKAQLRAPGTDPGRITAEQRQTILAEQAERFGLEPEEVDTALRAWRDEAEDDYESGLAALYAEQYSEASDLLGRSLERKKEALVELQREVIDNAVALGQSLYAQGRYAEAADAYREAVALDAENAGYLNSLAIALQQAGQYDEAEPFYERALAIFTRALGEEHPHTQQTKDNIQRLRAKMEEN